MSQNKLYLDCTITPTNWHSELFNRSLKIYLHVPFLSTNSLNQESNYIKCFRQKLKQKNTFLIIIKRYKIHFLSVTMVHCLPETIGKSCKGHVGLSSFAQMRICMNSWQDVKCACRQNLQIKGQVLNFQVEDCIVIK